LGTTDKRPMFERMPSLTVTKGEGSFASSSAASGAAKDRRCREAADDLIRRLLALVTAFRSSGLRVSCELQPDLVAQSAVVWKRV
jgi:hypothetical protein